jgi:3-oxoacyl-[acyl-carrier-protein] synthase-3
MQRIAISGRGVYLPRLLHTNESLPPLDKPATAEQLEKIGVVSRGWAGEGEGIAEMGAFAARQALERAGVKAEEIDLLILANWTQRRFIPEFAPKVQHLIGATRAFAFDLCGACTGFINGLATAFNFLQGPRMKRALVVASETTSQRARPNSRATLVFGDAAAAWVLEKDRAGGGELIDYELSSDGSQHGLMEINDEGHVVTLIDQKELNALAARSFAGSTRRILERNKLSLGDVQWIVPHSGTAGIQSLLVKTLEVPAEKVLSNYRTVGNVSSAAIPVSFEEFVSKGQIRDGDLILSPTTGTGWYHGAILYRHRA